MEQLNLSAADQWRKERQRPLDTSYIPEPTAAPADLETIARTLEVINRRSVRTRTGLAMVIGATYPGAGVLFMGSYIAAFIYALAFAVCAYMSIGMDTKLGVTMSWGWLSAAFAIWVVSFVHTAVLAASEEQLQVVNVRGSTN